jgi:hypothetical protein
MDDSLASWSETLSHNSCADRFLVALILHNGPEIFIALGRTMPVGPDRSNLTHLGILPTIST